MFQNLCTRVPQTSIKAIYHVLQVSGLPIICTDLDIGSSKEFCRHLFAASVTMHLLGRSTSCSSQESIMVYSCSTSKHCSWIRQGVSFFFVPVKY